LVGEENGQEIGTGRICAEYHEANGLLGICILYYEHYLAVEYSS
jgi:hypothetical protein